MGLFAFSGHADNVSFSVSDGIDNATIKSKIESSVSKMLTEINAAQEAGRNLNFSAMGVGQRVQMSMAMLWENSPFKCTDDDIVEHCITTGTGYQVRNIPLEMKPTGERGKKYLEEHPKEPSPRRLLRYIDVKPHVPLYLEYFTAYPTPGTDSIAIWPDRYGYDRVIADAIPCK